MMSSLSPKNGMQSDNLQRWRWRVQIAADAKRL